MKKKNEYYCFCTKKTARTAVRIVKDNEVMTAYYPSTKMAEAAMKMEKELGCQFDYEIVFEA